MSYGKLWRYVASVLARAEGENGQGLGEYALVLVLVAVVAVLALTALGLIIPGFFEPVAAAMGL